MNEPLYRIAWIPLAADMAARVRINNLETVEKIGGHFVDPTLWNNAVLSENLADNICNQLNNETFDSAGSYIVIATTEE